MDSYQYGSLLHGDQIFCDDLICVNVVTADAAMSEIAETMRQEMTSMVLNGKTETEIYERYKSQYGEQILAVPDGLLEVTAFTVPVTVGVLSASALAYFLVRLRLRRSALDRTPAFAGENKSILEQIRAETEW